MRSPRLHQPPNPQFRSDPTAAESLLGHPPMSDGIGDTLASSGGGTEPRRRLHRKSNQKQKASHRFGTRLSIVFLVLVVELSEEVNDLLNKILDVVNDLGDNAVFHVEFLPFVSLPI